MDVKILVLFDSLENDIEVSVRKENIPGQVVMKVRSSHFLHPLKEGSIQVEAPELHDQLVIVDILPSVIHDLIRVDNEVIILLDFHRLSLNYCDTFNHSLRLGFCIFTCWWIRLHKRIIKSNAKII